MDGNLPNLRIVFNFSSVELEDLCGLIFETEIRVKF